MTERLVSPYSILKVCAKPPGVSVLALSQHDKNTLYYDALKKT